MDHELSTELSDLTSVYCRTWQCLVPELISSQRKLVMHAQKGISCSFDFPSLGNFAIAAASLRNSRNAVYPNGVRVTLKPLYA
jgi:hypothetical protein